ncbi:polysaccharide pyruvyl transferase family protein [Isoptericola sp. G70]|uniref:polysaccharide pyruvyl transferase family protein n=1 Tax=Isoptericola sp. G70 TaxID=3376633 RepID=UPI003A810B8B
MGRRLPETLGRARYRSVLDEYVVSDKLLIIDGKVPLNYFTYRTNFGDLLSPWLVRQMTGRDVVVADRSEPHYVVIGSVINQGTNSSIFWGTGTYGTEGKDEVARKARYTAVRGPLTRSKLGASKGFGIPVPAVYGDPALLLPLYYQPRVKVTHEYGVVVRWSERRWAEATYGPGVKLIDLGRDDVEGVIDDFLSCRRIITSSLHGLIVADVYGIPSAWLASRTPRGGEYKFYDYFASVQKFRQPHTFDPAAQSVTTDVLREAFTFSGEAITYDYRPLLDACPFLQRKNKATQSAVPRAAKRTLRREAGTPVLLPSLGYFGGIHTTRLSVRTSGQVQSVRLFLPARTSGQLDLRGIELYNGGQRVEIDIADVTIEQSSNAAKDDRSPFLFGGIKSAKEVGPWWTARLDAPVEADEIRVYNRLDGYGFRNRSLSVAVAGADERLKTLTTTDSDAVVRETLSLLSRLTGRTLEEAVLGSAEEAAAERAKTLSLLAEKSQEGLLTADPREQQLLAALVPTRAPADGAELTDDEWALLGHLLAAERARVPGTATSMRAFQLILRTVPRLERLAHEVNRAGDALGTPRAVLTRHGIVDDGGLRERSADYLATIERAAALLDQCGYPAMLAYGTLLGAVRDGDFLAHDDDVDMMIPLDAPDRAAAEPVLAELRAALREAGWKVSRPNTYTNFHLHDPENGLHVDVFPVFVDGERATLHMEKMRLRAIPTGAVMPPTPLTFKGRKLLGPADPEAFLAERYGETWSVPDPYYDWPWRLDG